MFAALRMRGPRGESDGAHDVSQACFKTACSRRTKFSKLLQYLMFRAVSSDPKVLGDVFKVRNRIIHELDIDFGGTNRKRVPRRKKDMMKNVNLIFKTANLFLYEVEKRC